MINKIQNLSKSKNRKYVIFPLFGLFIMGVLILETLKSENNIADLGFNGLLVLITFMYTYYTKDILEDGKTKREIEFIQRQLEYFYYPMLRVMENVQLAAKEVHYTEKNNAYFLKCFYTINPIFNENYKKIYIYQYLANEDIREKLLRIKIYMEYINAKKNDKSGKIIRNNYEYSKYFREHQKEIFQEIMDFKDEIEDEIEIINDKLIDLIN